MVYLGRDRLENIPYSSISAPHEKHCTRYVGWNVAMSLRFSIAAKPRNKYHEALLMMVRVAPASSFRSQSLLTRRQLGCSARFGRCTRASRKPAAWSVFATCPGRVCHVCRRAGTQCQSARTDMRIIAGADVRRTTTGIKQKHQRTVRGRS